MSVHHVHACFLLGLEEDIGSLGSGVLNHHVGAGFFNAGPLVEQQVL